MSTLRTAAADAAPPWSFFNAAKRLLAEAAGEQDDYPDDASSGAGGNFTNTTDALVVAEEEHAHDAITTLYLNVTIIGCLLLAYYVKKFRVYYLPESAGAIQGTFVALTVLCVAAGARLAWQFGRRLPEGAGTP